MLALGLEDVIRRCQDLDSFHLDTGFLRRLARCAVENIFLELQVTPRKLPCS